MIYHVCITCSHMIYHVCWTSRHMIYHVYNRLEHHSSLSTWLSHRLFSSITWLPHSLTLYHVLKLSNTENRLSDQVLTWRTERDRYGTEPRVRVPRVREPKVRVPRIHQLRWQLLKPQSPETKERKPPSPKPQAASRKPQVLGPWARAKGLGQRVRAHGTALDFSVQVLRPSPKTRFRAPETTKSWDHRRQIDKVFRLVKSSRTSTIHQQIASESSTKE